MFEPGGIAFQTKRHGQATEQMWMELGPHAFGHRVDNGFPDLTMGQGSGFSVASRKKP